MKTLKLGVAGLGHVGCGLVDLVQKQEKLRLPGKVEVAGVTARNRSRNRPVSIESYAWYDDASKLAASDDIDVFVELIGGSDGPAKVAVETAIKSGKSVITANKALIAMHGQELAELAREHGVDLLFEAAVAGGVPIVRVLRDSLAGVDIQRVTGILNGTCNFLLSEMLSTRRPYDVVLAEAQRLGYAEADPTLDVSGMDAAHKAAILAAIAFSADLDFSQVSVRGVDEIELLDLDLADRLGLRIKLIAEGKVTPDGVVCRVEPLAMPIGHPLARISGSLNTIRVEGDPLGAVTLTGPGAGPGPTASAVMGDVAKLFNPIARPAFGRAEHHGVRKFVRAEPNERSAFFLRVRLDDRAGALAELTEALAESGVSVDKLLQDSADENGAAPIAIVTHICSRSDINEASDRVRSLETNVGHPQIVAIEEATD
ncbi:homoserine dehydrogenase [Henriciella aquimarina]|uniref:homoserine dehydrogenase n=1 Tax=Henriciella aquimarina TaxID=545261 RepID=UPI000A07A06E|nr:homoserine dehydrogenase [Henriciella aquimarina]